MRIIKHLIDRNIELYEEFKLKRFYQRSIWKFFSALNIALAFLKVQLPQEEIDEINSFCSRIILLEYISEKQAKLLDALTKKYEHYLIECLELIGNLQEEKGQKGDLYKPKMIGMSAYEFYNA